MFPTTAWSLLRKSQFSEADAARLNAFMASYWRPVLFFIRQSGFSLHDAEDLTQAFFEKVWEKGLLLKADEERGRFRTFLLACLKRFLADRRGAREKRQDRHERNMVKISALMTADDKAWEPSNTTTPDDVYMNRWAHAVVEHARRRLENWCQQQGRPDWYRVFNDLHFGAGPEQPSLTQQELARRLGVTRDQVRYGVEKAEDQFSRLLREEVADQVTATEDVEQELKELRSLL